MEAHQAPRPWDSPGRNTGVGSISFSNAWKWKVKVKSLSRVWLFVTPWTVAYQAPPSCRLSWDFPGKRTGVGCHCLLLYHLSAEQINWRVFTLSCHCAADWAERKGGFDLFTIYSSENKLSEIKADLQSVDWFLASKDHVPVRFTQLLLPGLHKSLGSAECFSFFPQSNKL